MQIVCDACGHSGPPARIWRSDASIALECGECGHIGPIAAPSPVGALDEPTPAPQPTPEQSPAQEPGHVQCQKCAHYQAEGDSCDRCGFRFDNYQLGEMPWEQPPSGAEEQWTQALALWEAVERAPNAEETHERFMQYCRENTLDELAARRYRFLLADQPNNALARAQLDVMLTLGQQRMLSQLEGDRSAASAAARKTRQRLTIAVFVFCVLAIVLFLWSFPNLFR